MEVLRMYRYFVGIDVSKDSFSVSGLNGEGTVVCSLNTLMDKDGFYGLAEVLSSWSDDPSAVIVGMESTGSYHVNLVSFLKSKGFPVIVVNPLLISNFTKLSLRKTKTDKKDAHTIARFILAHRDSLSRFAVSQVNTHLRDIARERESILKFIAAAKNDIRRMLKSTFPELEKMCDVFSDVMLLFLKEFPSARILSAADPSDVTRAFSHADGRMRIRLSIKDLVNAAHHSIAFPHPALEMILPWKIATLIHLNERLDEVTKLLVRFCESVMKEDLDIIISLDGVNTKTAAPFLAEMGDYRNYKSYKNFIAYTGLDPSIHQSGTLEGISKLSKRGNRHLRRVIYLMTFCAIRVHGPFKEYFQRRKREGLPFKKALFATAHKLIRTIFAMLTKRTYYRCKEMIIS
jgi:transposase